MMSTTGKLHGPNDLFLRVSHGNATNEATGTVYELSVSMTGLPIVRSSLTGNAWTIGWQELLQQAIAAGIDMPLNEEAA